MSPFPFCIILNSHDGILERSVNSGEDRGEKGRTRKDWLIVKNITNLKRSQFVSFTSSFVQSFPFRVYFSFCPVDYPLILGLSSIILQLLLLSFIFVTKNFKEIWRKLFLACSLPFVEVVWLKTCVKSFYFKGTICIASLHKNRLYSSLLIVYVYLLHSAWLNDCIFCNIISLIPWWSKDIIAVILMLVMYSRSLDPESHITITTILWVSKHHTSQETCLLPS